jgi:very-short-patch-repair endonuclease
MSKYDTEYIKATCRWLRRNQTQAEEAFWDLVRNRNILQKKFYRQYPILFEYESVPGFFVADFYCHECSLVIEIDGGIHEKQKEYDSKRTLIINELGINVIRFSNESVLDNIERVRKELIETLKNLTE